MHTVSVSCQNPRHGGRRCNLTEICPSDVQRLLPCVTAPNVARVVLLYFVRMTPVSHRVLFCSDQLVELDGNRFAVLNDFCD